MGSTSGSATINIRMPDQYVDAESGLFYNWNRYYNPSIGRYISSDPIGIDGGLNTFLYAFANPLMYMDMEGLEGIGLLQALLPAHTAAFSRNPIGGSVEAQLDYANRVNQLRAFEVGMATIAIASNIPAGMGSALTKTALQRSCPVQDPWKFGSHKSANKWQNQMQRRGWTEQEISETIATGRKSSVPNKINPANTATRYENIRTGKSVVVDDVTKEILQVGGSGFKY